jgi:hypothetical protein
MQAHSRNKRRQLPEVRKGKQNCLTTRLCQGRLVISFLGVLETSSATLCSLDGKWPGNMVISFGYASFSDPLTCPVSVTPLKRVKITFGELVLTGNRSMNPLLQRPNATTVIVPHVSYHSFAKNFLSFSRYLLIGCPAKGLTRCSSK